jgi:hypothetical protein
MLITNRLSIILLLILSVNRLYAEEGLDFKIGVQAVNGTYTGSTIKDSIESRGIILNLTFLEDFTITHTSTDTDIKFLNPENDIKQTSKFTTIGYNFYSNSYGKINIRVDHQSIDNDDITKETDDVSVNSAQVSILPYDEGYYLEVGYSKSIYPYEDNFFYDTELIITQANATYGTGLSTQDWLSIKAYQINSSDENRTQEQESFSAFEVRYKYFFGGAFLNINNIELLSLSGERVYAVDGAAGSAYNMGDMQTGTFGLSIEWKFGDNANLLFSVSQEKYRDKFENDYTGDYTYLNYNYNF